MKKIAVLILSLLASFAFYSCKEKTPYATGLEFDEKKYEKVPRKARLITRDYENLPESVDLRPYAPYPGDQGSYGTLCRLVNNVCRNDSGRFLFASKHRQSKNN